MKNRKTIFHVVFIIAIMGLIGTNMSLRTQANQANQQLIQCGQLDQFKVDDLKIKVVTRDSIISNLMILIDKLGAEKAL